MARGTQLIFLYLLVIAAGHAAAQAANGNGGKQKAPNILFCIADDMSFRFLNAYHKTPWLQTPAFDYVAREGVLFANAYTPNSKCAPSRACILTGRNPWQLEEAGNHVPYFPDKFVTWMEALGDNGYRTGFTGKGWAPGKAGNRNGKPRQLTGPLYNQKKITPPTPAMSNIDYAENFREFLSEKPGEQPFCFWFGAAEPHRGYTYGSGVSVGGKKTADIAEVPPYWPDNEVVRNDLLDYALEVEYFDRQLGAILKLLGEAGELENTIVVVTSDNGMPFPRVKGNVYEFSNHLPLAMMWKGKMKSKGRTVTDYVSFIDFAPTFLAAAGVDAGKTGMQPVQGRSLLPLLLSDDHKEAGHRRNLVLLGRERTDVGRPDDAGFPVRGLVKDGYFYLKNYEPARWPAGNPETGYLDSDGGPTKTEILNRKRHNGKDTFWDLSFGKRPSEELYQLTEDPHGMKNLAADAAHLNVLKKLRNEMEAALKKQGDPRMFGKGAIFDRYPYAEEATADFYNRWKKGEKLKAGWVSPSDFEVSEYEK